MGKMLASQFPITLIKGYPQVRATFRYVIFRNVINRDEGHFCGIELYGIVA